MATSTILANSTFLSLSSSPKPNLHPKPHSFRSNNNNHHHLPLQPKPQRHLLLPLAIKPPAPIRSFFPTNSPRSPFPSIPAIPLPSPADVTPLTVCKWAAIAAVAVAAAKTAAGVLLSPFFWMYFSWTWIYWPWFVAVGVGIYGLYCLRKHLVGESNVVEQLAVVTATVTWLTLVPSAHYNGFLEGWPVVFFFVYHYFFFFESSVRKRLYGDLQPRPHDAKWDVKLPRAFNVVFSVLVFVGHWLAALEGWELHLVPGGWSNGWIMWGLIMMVLFMRYHSVLYLAKYSEKVAVPTAVVQFGPYRWVRHPIYASTILLFVAYCIALRSPLSLAFVVAVCLVYYGRKAALEEGLMMDAFGERYAEYMSKVRRPLLLYLSTMQHSMGAVLGQHDESGRKERAIYYRSKKFNECEARYSTIEKTCLSFVWAAQKLRHYMMA